MAIAAALILAAVVVRWIRAAYWRRATRQAIWLEITPPVTATEEATRQMWRLLADQLRAAGRLALVPRRLVFEVHATPDRTRAGIWVPPQLTPLAVTRAVEQAWPGVRLEQTDAPRLAATAPTVGQRLATRRQDWLPLTADRHIRADDTALDPLRAVYGGLAAAGRTGGALLQVVVQRAPRRRLRTAALACRDPAKAARRRTGTRRLAMLAADALRAMLRGALDLAQPAATRDRPTAPSLWYAELARQARAKYADGPHLLLAVRVTTTGPTKAAARAAADTVTGGFGLIATDLSRRRMLRPATEAETRWVREESMVLATVAETAAFARLPAEPAAYGMPGAASRRRAGTTDTWRPDRDTRQADHRRDAPTAEPDDPWSYV